MAIGEIGLQSDVASLRGICALRAKACLGG
jgi:hypothetical protein